LKLKLLVARAESTLEEALAARRAVEAGFRGVVEAASEVPEVSAPGWAYSRGRRQYLASAFVKLAEEARRARRADIALIVTSLDLYAPGLNFVFGEAMLGAGVVSTARLKQSFWGLPEDSKLFKRRLTIVARHEVGHALGLPHCMNWSCFMHFHNSVYELDIGGTELCESCWRRLQAAYGLSRGGLR